MSKQPQGNATIVFALLSGEEQGLMGGRLLAETAKERGWKVSAMLNNDIVGNTVGTDGRVVTDRVRVFSEGIRASEDIAAQLARRGSGGEDDGPSRSLMRFAGRVAEAESDRVGLAVLGIRRPDRFSRGGDHLPALELGFPAIRFTVGVENYNHQHQDLRTESGIEYGDTVDKMDFSYLAKVTALNIATASALAAAPPAPASATLGGAVSSDTTVTWSPVSGAAGYHVYWRWADKQQWEDMTDIDDAAATTTTLKGVIVDDHFVGVASVDAEGNESTITFAGLPPRP
jgi:Zn-dependent M28 family amino/carboxypeptidase